MTHDAKCECFDCVSPADKLCAKTIGCTLRPDHAGRCLGMLGYIRLGLRSVWSAYRSLIAEKLRRNG